MQPLQFNILMISNKHLQQLDQAQRHFCPVRVIPVQTAIYPVRVHWPCGRQNWLRQSSDVSRHNLHRSISKPARRGSWSFSQPDHCCTCFRAPVRNGARAPAASNASQSASHKSPISQRNIVSPSEYIALMADVDDGIRAAQEHTRSNADLTNAGSKSPSDINASSSQSSAATDGSCGSSSSSSSSSSSDTASDKWSDTLAVNHTLSSLYLRKVEVQQIPQLDFAERRRKRELREICDAAAKKGIKADMIEANLNKLQGLVPGLNPNLDQMKASDWAKILSNVDGVVAVVITLKTFYPKADVGSLLQRTPKLLLKPLQQIQQDAQKVRSMLQKVDDVDAIIEAVPYLMDPAQLVQSLANLARWFPNQDPFEMLQKNPQMLVNIEEADLEADPLYGLSFW